MIYNNSNEPANEKSSWFSWKTIGAAAVAGIGLYNQYNYIKEVPKKLVKSTYNIAFDAILEASQENYQKLPPTFR